MSLTRRNEQIDLFIDDPAFQKDSFDARSHINYRLQIHRRKRRLSYLPLRIAADVVSPSHHPGRRVPILQVLRPTSPLPHSLSSTSSYSSGHRRHDQLRSVDPLKAKVPFSLLLYPFVPLSYRLRTLPSKGNELGRSSRQAGRQAGIGSSQRPILRCLLSPSEEKKKVFRSSFRSQFRQKSR